MQTIAAVITPMTKIAGNDAIARFGLDFAIKFKALLEGPKKIYSWTGTSMKTRNLRRSNGMERYQAKNLYIILTTSLYQIMHLNRPP